MAVAHENGAVRRERTARDECSGKRRDRDRITVARSTARHNAAHAYAAEAIRCAALGMAELPFCIRESGRWASLTLHVRLPSPHLVTGLRSTAQIGTRAYGALWCARVLRHRACEFVRNDDHTSVLTSRTACAAPALRPARGVFWCSGSRWRPAPDPRRRGAVR